MADDNHPNQNPDHDPEKKPDHKDDEKIDFKKVQDKYNELKTHPKVKATKGLFANYFVEITYLVAVLVSFIISLTRPGNGGLVFVGIGFLVGLFLFSLLKSTSHRVGGFLTKQELVVHIIMAIILVILSFIIPTIMMGLLVGVPAGFGLRHWMIELRGHPPHHDDNDDEHQPPK